MRTHRRGVVVQSLALTAGAMGLSVLGRSASAQTATPAAPRRAIPTRGWLRSLPLRSPARMSPRASSCPSPR